MYDDPTYISTAASFVDVEFTIRNEATGVSGSYRTIEELSGYDDTFQSAVIQGQLYSPIAWGTPQKDGPGKASVKMPYGAYNHFYTVVGNGQPAMYVYSILQTIRDNGAITTDELSGVLIKQDTDNMSKGSNKASSLSFEYLNRKHNGVSQTPTASQPALQVTVIVEALL